MFTYDVVSPAKPKLGRVAPTSYPTSLTSQLAAIVRPPGTDFVDPATWYTKYQQANPAPQYIADPATRQIIAGWYAGGAPTATPAVSASASAPSGGGISLGDYSNDPILQKAQAAVEAQMKQAEAQAEAAKKTNLIRYGDVDLAKKAGIKDQDTLDAIKNNSFSTTAELGRWNQRALDAIDVNRASQNLFYSSTRARDRGLQEEDLVRQKTTTGNQLQDALTAIAQNELAQKNAAQQQLLAAMESAYSRALQLAMFQAQLGAFGASGGGSSSSGGGNSGGGTTPTASGGGLPSVPAIKAKVGYGTTIPWTAGL